MRGHVIGVFVASGLVTAFAGVLLASKLRIGQASVGLEYLLPALVGAFLGSTTIRPGRVNVWGTLVGVLIPAVGISGIQQFGAAFFVEPLFNGATLIVAIGIAGHAQRRRSAVRRTRSAGDGSVPAFQRIRSDGDGDGRAWLSRGQNAVVAYSELQAGPPCRGSGRRTNGFSCFPPPRSRAN